MHGFSNCILINKSCLFVKLLELFHYTCFVLHFAGPNTWTGGNVYFLGLFWWNIDQVIIGRIPLWRGDGNRRPRW
jgi:hypothetical protein